MSKYIDTDKLITGIEQLKETNKVLSTRQLSEYLQGSIYGFDLAVEKILSIISSFQQEQEVADLEKEIDRVFFWFFSSKTAVVIDCIIMKLRTLLATSLNGEQFILTQERRNKI